ncbi:MAG: DEAD/DEAH box helicase family protein, partial [archaeon]|nr:DEAD/DEAH box helicase family protein [archaeon]
MSFRTVIEKYRKSQFSKQDLGRHFERLMQAFLRTYQIYDGEFENVWLWEDFPYRYDFGSGQDIGIDIVCKTLRNEYWAVQCKCYGEDAVVDKGSVDTFITTSGKKPGNFSFSHRLWISTTNNWSSHAEEALKDQDPEVQRLNLNDLESARVDWDKLDEGIYGVNARLEKFDIRDYQKEAREAVHNYFKTRDRGKLIMACGTGKTFLALKIAEYETNSKGIILVLTPSISLISQSLRTWCEQ